MKFLVAFILLACGREVSAEVANPISRVVSLLKGLQEKLEKDLEGETDLFETYRCWYKSTKENKEASNAAAKSRIQELETYIADVKAGKVEFTTERVDLEKQIAGLEKDLSDAKAMRESENKDFLAAEDEMKKAIAAMDKAIETIAEATKGSLVQKKSYLGMLSTKHSLQSAIAFGRGLLAADDVQYLEDMLNDGPDDPDWKKLNRKATFKMKYKARSTKISTLLNGMSATFKRNLKEAQDKETKDAASYKKLKNSKDDLLSAANTALNDQTKENGAKGKSLADSEGEVDDLTKQKTDDEKFIKDTTTAYDAKTKEWDARKELRGKEILAMSQAIATLHSDDARDQFKTSFKSQGYSMLIQEASRSLREPERRTKCAARLVQSLAEKSSDPMLLQLARTAGNSGIEKVVKSIDKMVAAKKTEEETDLTDKQKCEEDLSAAARDAKKTSVKMDTNTEDIERAKTKVAEIAAEIKEKEADIATIDDQKAKADTQRKRENEDAKQSGIDDAQAVTLIKTAIKQMKDWKTAKAATLVTIKKTNMIGSAVKEILKPEAPALIQVTSSSSADPQFAVDAGSAPPPPPATWDTGATYGGASGSSTGIVSILSMCQADVEKDAKAAVDAEADSLKEYNALAKDLADSKKDAQKLISDYKSDKADQEKSKTEKTSERATQLASLNGQIKLYNSYKPGCDFLLVNFDLRTKSRQIEVDGLQKAKAILQGGKFDSFLQLEC